MALPVEVLAARVSAALACKGFSAVLTGGSCVTIYARGEYVSRDIDLVVSPGTDLPSVTAALAELGFQPSGREYSSPESEYLVDIQAPPLSVGAEIIHRTAERRVGKLRLNLLTASDCVKDRLAAYYHWSDEQGLEQAILVCLNQKVNMREIGRWSRTEGMEEEFRRFQRVLKTRRRRQ